MDFFGDTRGPIELICDKIPFAMNFLTDWGYFELTVWNYILIKK